MADEHRSEWEERLEAGIERAGASVLGVKLGRGRRASAVVWDTDGHAVTSARAAGDAERLELTLPDGQQVEGERVGSHAGTDVALLKIGADTVTPATFRPVPGLKLGRTTVALGRPGKALRASQRIVGLLEDDVRTPRGSTLEHYVETDRGLPAGFDGGPLIDGDGDVIGMNTTRLWRGGDLAIPHVTLARIVHRLRDDGRVPHGYLGVSVQPVPLPRAVRGEREARRAALVVGLDTDGPAERSGVRFGDVLLDLDGQSVTGPRSLFAALADRAASDTPATVLRGGEEVSLTLQVGQRP